MPPRARLGVIAGVAAAAALLLCGCGSSAAKKSSSRAGSKLTAASFRAKDCQPAGSHGGTSYRLCRQQVDNQHGTFLRVRGKERAVLALARPGPTPTSKYGGRSGYWDWAALSPDGTQFLAQWRGDCEAPINFFISLGGGKPVSVTGESDWLKSPETLAFGWTTDGRAIVFIPTKPACGSGVFHPGIYLVTASCRLQLFWAGKGPPVRLERSLKPRTLTRLKSLLRSV